MTRPRYDDRPAVLQLAWLRFLAGWAATAVLLVHVALHGGLR